MNHKRCSKCQALGHIAADYPNRKVITLAEWDTAKDEVAEEEKEEDLESQEEEEQEEVIADAHEGEMLVLRRALSSRRSEKEEQIENIFLFSMYYLGRIMFVNHRWGQLC